MYYPDRVRRSLAEYLYGMGVAMYQRPYDRLVRDYIIDKRLTLLSTTPSLVQHIGVLTTGLGGNFHQSPSFL